MADKRGFETAYEPCLNGRTHSLVRWGAGPRSGLNCAFCDRTWTRIDGRMAETARGRVQ